VVVYTCDEKHIPNGLLMPFHQHSRQLQVAQIQVEASLPLKKRLWQQLVQNKILNQAVCLERCDSEDNHLLEALAREVQSGDKGNKEAQAAKLYWPRLFGTRFRRFSQTHWTSSALNYGYAILRGAMARAVVANGLLPCFGLNHQSQLNAFNLVDDLIEPFRPLVDETVYQLVQQVESTGDEDVSNELPRFAKHQLVLLTQKNCTIDQEVTPLPLGCQRLSESLVRALRDKEPAALLRVTF
jgi:CRISPR-associated protein Cas1